MSFNHFAQPLPNGKYKVMIPSGCRTDMIASTGQLLVRTGWAFKVGDIIVVRGVEATITKCDPAWEWANHNWMLTIECDQMEVLRDRLSYRVEERIQDD